MRYLLFLWALLLSSNTYSNICLDINLPDGAGYHFENNIKIKTFDGLELSANTISPKEIKGPLPTIIFVNSWTLDEHEYLRQAILLAKKGYLVLSYSSRGWGCSQGKINVIGPKDWKDISSVIDWLEQNNQTDMKKIGISGISYGGGMTLMALAKEPRIKTGFAMSTWGSLPRALYYQNTARLFWGAGLIGTGLITGSMEPETLSLFSDLIRNRNIPTILEWARLRSPITYIDEINRRNAPLYISNNFGDNLFQPNNILEFYNKLTVPKILDLNQGTHATGEITGLFTVSNYTFNKLHDWFDYWLKPKHSNHKPTSLVFNTINIQTDLKHKRESISSDVFNHLKKTSFFLHPRKIISGKLSEKTYSHGPDINLYHSGLDTIASTGIPLLSALIDGNFRIPVYRRLNYVNPLNGIKFQSEKLESTFKLRGTPKLSLNILSNSKNFQVMAYLYDINESGFAKLITHGAYSGLSNFEKVKMEMVTTAYDIPQNHSIALVLDTKDLLYATKTIIPYRIELIFDPSFQAKLELPSL